MAVALAAHGSPGAGGECRPRVKTLKIPSIRYHQSIASWKQNLRVVLISTRNPLNIGASARAMANFGFSKLRVVNPYDVAFREARSAVGAAPLLQAAEERPCANELWCGLQNPERWIHRHGLHERKQR